MEIYKIEQGNGSIDAGSGNLQNKICIFCFKIFFFFFFFVWFIDSKMINVGMLQHGEE